MSTVTDKAYVDGNILENENVLSHHRDVYANTDANMTTEFRMPFFSNLHSFVMRTESCHCHFPFWNYISNLSEF